MLAQIRTFAKSPVATVLLGLLVVSFAVFGIADVFRNQVHKDAVVEAGSRTVGTAEFKQLFDNYKKQIEQQQNGGMPITTQQAVAAGVDRGLADSLAQSESFAAMVTKMGVVPSDKLVVGEIRKTQAFFDPVTGRFDKQTYQQRLAQADLTEAQYERLLRDQVAQGQLLSGLAAGLEVPRTYMAAVAAYNREGRDFSWFLLPPALAGAPTKPTDADLADYIKKNAARFTKPELRQLSFVRFSPSEFAAGVPVNPADVQKRFDFEKETLSIPATRSLVQVPVKDLATGAQAAQRLRMGEDAGAVAKALGVSTVSYNDAPKTGVSDRKVADAVFGPVKVGDVIGPIQGTLGLAVIKVLKVTDGHLATIDEARPKISAEIQKEGATEKVYQVVQKYEDARSGGANMAEAAKKSGAMIVPLSVPISAMGTTLDGKQVQVPAKVLQAAFSLPQGSDSDVIDLGQGEYAAVRVDKVMPSALATVDEVRPAATQILILDTMVKKLKAKADELTAAMKKGQTMDQAAASIGAKVQTAADVQRSAAGKTFSNDFMQKIFNAKPGEVVVGEDQKLGLVVGKLTKIGSGPPAELAAQIEVQRSNFRNVLFNDFNQAIKATARAEIKPKVDYALARTALGLDAVPAGGEEVNASPDFDGFAERYDAGHTQAISTRLIDDIETPVSAFLKIGQGRPFAFLFESVEGGAWRGRYSIVAMKPDLVWRCFGDRAETAVGTEAIAAGRYEPQAAPALESLRALVAETRFDLPADLPPMAAGLFGVLGYDMIRQFEPIGPAKPDALGLPDAVMIRPSVVAVFDSIGQEIVLATPVRPEPGVSARQAYEAATARLAETVTDLAKPLAAAPVRTPKAQDAPASPVSRADYHRIVGRAKDYIAAGDIFQVVPSHRFRARFDLAPFAFYRSLRRLNPSPFLFYLNFGDFQLSGSSPEILVRLRDGKVTIRPIAGTRPRGATPEQDAENERELLADPKERAEHLMLLDLGRNDVGRAVMLNDAGRNEASTAPRVKVTESFTIERYSTVMHIVSNVEGAAPEGLDPVDVILTALPAGTLSGAPKVRAMQIIDELETEKRGVAYAGAAGYISANGSVDTCIILRTALFKDGMMYVQGGGGVVADSDPDAEYDETLHKTRALRRAAEEAWRFR